MGTGGDPFLAPAEQGQCKQKGRGEDSGFLNKEPCPWCVIEVLEEEKRAKNGEMRRELDIWGKGGDGRKELESVNRTSEGAEVDG